MGRDTKITVYDAREDSWWGLSKDDRARFTDWLKNEGYEPDGRAVYRTEIHAGDAPFARVFAYALDEQGHKYLDPESGDVAELPPCDVRLSSPPPVQPYSRGEICER